MVAGILHGGNLKVWHHMYSIAAAIRGSIYQRKNTPGPGTYSIPENAEGPKYKFSRRILASSFQGTKVPGPGTYQPNHSLVEKPISKRVTFGAKADLPFSGKETPGPGAYIDPYLNTTLKLATSAKIGKSARNDTLDPYKTDGPGPAAYSAKPERITRGGKFTKDKRRGIYWASVAPGPGSYPVRTLIGTEGTKPSVAARRPDTSPRYGEHSPGPGAYQVRTNKSSLGFSMSRGKRNETFELRKGPDPLSYSPNENPKTKSCPSWTYYFFVLY